MIIVQKYHQRKRQIGSQRTLSKKGINFLQSHVEKSFSNPRCSFILWIKSSNSLKAFIDRYTLRHAKKTRFGLNIHDRKRTKSFHTAVHLLTWQPQGFYLLRQIIFEKMFMKYNSLLKIFVGRQNSRDSHKIAWVQHEQKIKFKREFLFFK